MFKIIIKITWKLKGLNEFKQIKEKTSSIIDNLLISSSITDEFKSLIDSMNFENVLAENIFKIFKEYFSYDVAGLFFNNSDAQKRNVLNLSLPNKNIPLKTIDEIRDKFFDEMNKLNRIRSLNYTSFYCARSDSFIILNNELLDQAFDDILQSKIDCDNLCGVYTNKDINKTLIIYYDPKGTQYKMSINSE